MIKKEEYDLKRILVFAIFLIFILLSLVCSLAMEYDTDEAEAEVEYSVLCLSPEDQSFVGNVNNIVLKRDDSINSRIQYDIVDVGTSIPDNKYGKPVRELLDNGSIIYYSCSNITSDEITQWLGITAFNKTKTKGAFVTGEYIGKDAAGYYIGTIGYTVCFPENYKGEEIDYLNNSKIKNIKLNIRDFMSHIDNLKIKTNENIKSRSPIYNVVFNGNYVYSHHLPGMFLVIGANSYIQLPENYSGELQNCFAIVTIIQYRYEVCTFYEDSMYKGITDILTSFSVDAENSSCIVVYQPEINVNTSQIMIANQSSFEDNNQISVGFSGGSEFGLNSTINFGPSLSYSFNPGQQTIQNLGGWMQRKWRAIPNSTVVDGQWELVPSIEMINEDISNNYVEVESSIYSLRIARFNTTYDVNSISIVDDWPCFFRRGDINIDGYFTNADLIILARYIAGIAPLEHDQLVVANFDGVGGIDNADLVALSRYIVSL